MKALFWLLALFALAVGLTLALRYHGGYVLVVTPPYRTELSLNLALVLLAAAFFLGYVLLRLAIATVRLPAKVREYHARRQQEKAHTAMLEAFRSFFEGRYGRAEKAAAAALEQGAAPAPVAVLAAHAAQELRAHDRRDAYLARGEGAAPAEKNLFAMTRASFLLDEHRPLDALAVLKDLPHQHTAALRLELKAQQQAKNWDQTLALAAQLEKRQALDPVQIEQVKRRAHLENLRRKALDSEALLDYWGKLAPRDKKDRGIARVAAQCFMALGGCEIARQIIEQSLESQWDGELVGLYGECPGKDALEQIERAENWLKTRDSDAMLLMVLGRLCAHQQLWGKAQSYLEASLAVEPTHSAHLALAQLLERIGRKDDAFGHYRQSLELALAQLRNSSGGRRKAAL